MKTLFAALLLVASNSAFASENVVIEGRIRDSGACSPLKAVQGRISDSGKKILVCAGDLQTASFTNGATSAALSDGKMYYIVGTLHEGTLSVSEVARIGE